MDDFLYVLQCELEEKLTGEQILYQLNLYRKYMSEQMAEGKTEAQVLQKLGDPTVVAQKVMEAYENKEKQEAAQRGNALKDPFPLTAEEMNAQIKNPELKLNSWYGTLIILGVVLVIFILLSYLKSHM